MLKRFIGYYKPYKNLFARSFRLPIPCGVNPYLEVDVWSEKKRLAVMLDKSEFISDVALYRQSRHEDALLQRNGIRVIRFLVEDVCESLDTVLGEIEVLSQPCPTVLHVATKPQARRKSLCLAAALD